MVMLLGEEVDACSQEMSLRSKETHEHKEEAENIRVATYGDFWIQREMLFDSIRTDAYHAALTALVKPGDVVVDFGCGTGILAMMAAKAGAKKVYGIEISEMAHFARKLVKANNLDHIVTILQADAQTVQLPEKADILVSEWMGGLGVDEGFIPNLIRSKQNLLKPTGIMIPSHARGYASLAYDKNLLPMFERWQEQKYGIDLSLVADTQCNTVLNARHHITNNTLLSAPAMLFSIDMNKIGPKDGDFEFTGEDIIQQDGHITCIAAWFECDMGDGKQLSNAPELPDTHWGRTSFPISPIKVSKGDKAKWFLHSHDKALMKSVQTWGITLTRADGTVVSHTHSGTQVPVHSPGFH